jgi:hypothetical protein
VATVTSEELNDEHLPVGGWLIIVVIGILLSAAYAAYMSYYFFWLLRYTLLDVSMASFNFLLSGAKYIAIIVLAAVCLYLNYFYLKAFRWAVIALYILPALVITYELLTFRASDPSSTATAIFMSWIPSLIWVPYVLFGRRAKQTYIYDFKNNPWLKKSNQ